MRAFGANLKSLASRTEGRVLLTFLVGLLVAVLLQSSAATAMISAGFEALGVDVGNSISPSIPARMMFNFLGVADVRRRGLILFEL